uniref:Uncharacterized protein n=1 Tax=Oryza rufipogon TaxID=4529 RepID=A0A0E0PAG4_ORYRU
MRGGGAEEIGEGGGDRASGEEAGGRGGGDAGAGRGGGAERRANDAAWGKEERSDRGLLESHGLIIDFINTLRLVDAFSVDSTAETSICHDREILTLALRPQDEY